MLVTDIASQYPLSYRACGPITLLITGLRPVIRGGSITFSYAGAAPQHNVTKGYGPYGARPRGPPCWGQGPSGERCSMWHLLLGEFGPFGASKGGDLAGPLQRANLASK